MKKMKLGMYNIVVKAVILRGNKVLLLRRTKYQKWNAQEWDIPGGRLEEGEDPKKAIHREVKEETGIKIKLGPVFDCFYFYSPADKVNKVSISFLAKYISGKLRISDEHELAEWHNINKISKEVTLWVRKAILDAIKYKKCVK